MALGSDYDGATIPAPLGDVAGTPKLLDALADAGFSEGELRADRVGQLAARARRVVGLTWREVSAVDPPLPIGNA